MKYCVLNGMQWKGKLTWPKYYTSKGIEDELYHKGHLTKHWQAVLFSCVHNRVSGFSSKLSNVSGNFSPQSLGQINEACKFSEFSEAVYYPPGAWTKWLWPLYQWKKNCSDYGVHGIQIDWLGLTISMQKSDLKKMHRVPRYHPKCVNFCWFGLEGRFWTLFW